MHTIKLKMDDDIYQNIIFILKNLQIKGLEIKEKEVNSITKSRLKELFANQAIEYLM